MRAELFALLVACGGETLSLGDGRGAQVVQPGAPVAIAELASEGPDDDPSLTSDLERLYFNTRRDGSEDIWWSARRDGAWSTPEPASELNTEDRETGIALARDGLQIWFSSDRDGDLDVYTATRATRDGTFATPERVSVLSARGDDLISALDPGGAYLARRADDDEDYDLYFAPRDGDSFAEAQPIASLNTDQEESDAFPVDDGLLFTRDGDLFLARRLDDGSYQAKPLAELNSSADDRDAWATPDLSVLIFSSDRAGEYQLYESRR
jgi:Tol biopolymer transport system component